MWHQLLENLTNEEMRLDGREVGADGHAVELDPKQ